MYTILFPTDGSDRSQQAAKQGMAFAKALSAKVVGLHVVRHYHMRPDEGDILPTNKTVQRRVEEDFKERGRQILVPVEEEARKAGVECECLVAVNDTIYEEIIDTAEKRRCDLIVMASHGHAGISGLLLGSETAKVLTHTKLPVLILR